MRDLTNLSWPEAPFGGAQRPFGRPARLICAVAFAWADTGDARQALTGTAVSYLHVRRTGALTITLSGYAFGFRATVVEHEDEVEELVALADRALVRARRHAAVLAANDLERDLDGLASWSSQRLAGVLGTRNAWHDRTAKGRGMAQMFDTKHDRTDVVAALDPPIASQRRQDARGLIERTLAIGLTAGRRLELLDWDGTFRVRDAVAEAAWDVVDQPVRTTSRGDQA
jgi:hypothetical protein